jgi:hypothetical protein
MDLERIRADTPAALGQSFLHSAGSSLSPTPVVEAVIEHLRLEQRLGGYAAADQEEARLDEVYDSVAALLNAERDEIALVENATVGWQMAFYAFDWRPGDRILTGQAEYAANYVAYLQVARRHGVVIDVIPDDAFGAVDPQGLRAMIDERVRWIPRRGGWGTSCGRRRITSMWRGMWIGWWSFARRRAGGNPMSGDATMKTKPEPPVQDRAAFDAMSAEERHAAALRDPDAQPITPETETHMRRTPQVRVIRRALKLSQEEFAGRHPETAACSD